MTEKRLGRKEIIIAIMLLLIVACIAMIAYLNISFTQELSADFSLSEIIIEDKRTDWTDAGYARYVTVKALKTYETGQETYFVNGKNVLVDSDEVFNAIPLGAKYMSCQLRIKMTYDEAKANDVLVGEDSLNIDKIVADDVLVKKYCHIISFVIYDD